MTICFTGHRPKGYSFGFDEQHIDCIRLKKYLSDEIRRKIADGADTFISGMALGADMWAAEAVLDLKKEFPHIKLIAAIPYPEQSKGWSEKYALRYNAILSKCDEKVIISPHYHSSCMHLRNRYMVDHSDVLIAIFDDSKKGGTASTLNYAKKKGMEITVLIP